MLQSCRSLHSPTLVGLRPGACAGGCREAATSRQHACGDRSGVDLGSTHGREAACMRSDSSAILGPYSPTFEGLLRPRQRRQRRSHPPLVGHERNSRQRRRRPGATTLVAGMRRPRGVRSVAKAQAGAGPSPRIEAIVRQDDRGPSKGATEGGPPLLLPDAYSGSAGVGAAVTASVLAAVRPSVSAQATGRPEPFAMRGVHGLATSESVIPHWRTPACRPRATLVPRRPGAPASDGSLASRERRVRDFCSSTERADSFRAPRQSDLAVS